MEQKLFVYFPYQFSTMKVFQNSNYGVIMAIPTPRFLKKIMLKDPNELEVKLFIKNSKLYSWTKYIDVYAPKYINMHLQFDNWIELFNIIKTAHFNISFIKKKYSKIINETMKWHSKTMKQKWLEFFKQTGFINGEK